MAVDFKDNSAEVLRKFRKAVQNGGEAIGKTGEGYAKEDIINAGAVDTGRLSNSISHAVQDNEVYIGTNVGYAFWHEVGTGIHASDGKGRKDPWRYQDEKGQWHQTRGVKPIHYLKNAATTHDSEYKDLMIQALKGNGIK